MINSVLLTSFYLTAAVLATLCIYIANNMTKQTCICIKHSMVLLILGIGFLVCSAYYTQPVWHRVLSILVIFWGLIGWLFFDRYMAHRDLAQIKDFIEEQIYYLKQFFKDLVS